MLTPRTLLRLLLLPALLAGCAGVPAHATLVSGQVTDPGGAPIPLVDLDFKDAATGMVVPTNNDDTDILGFYAVDVPPGTYEVQFEPADGDRFVAAEVFGVVVADVPLTLDQVLDPGFEVRGRVLTPELVPVDGARLDVRDALGNSLFSHLDRAGADGVVRPIVPAGSWQLKFSAPVAGEYLPVVFDNFVVDADHDFGDVVLTRAFQVTGRVVGVDGPPIGSVRVLAIDTATGAPPEGLSDTRSGMMGDYELWLPAGSYRLELTPAFGSPYSPRSFHGLLIEERRLLPDLPLDRAAVVDGRVVDQAGLPVVAADLDFDETASGLRLPTIQDDSDGMGNWEVVLPLETYDVSVDPPVGSALVAAEQDAVVIDGDTTLPDFVLLDGLALSARVLDPAGRPAGGVNVDVRDAVTGESLELYGDRSDAAGRFTVFVPPGDWFVIFRPPALSGWGQARVGPVGVAGTTDLGDIQLPAASTAAFAAIVPATGPETGGTLVTITGSGFSEGLRVLLDGRRLTGVLVLDGSTLQAVTPPHHRGAVELELVNPGSAPVSIPEAFAYERDPAGPLLTLRREGPFDNDLLLEWTAVGGPAWAVYRSASPVGFGRDELQRETGRLRWRDEGGVLEPGLIFYVVH